MDSRVNYFEIPVTINEHVSNVSEMFQFMSWKLKTNLDSWEKY